jgi:hypothetical protein
MRVSKYQLTAQFLIPLDGQAALGIDSGVVITLYLAAVFDWLPEKFSAIQRVNQTSNLRALTGRRQWSE